MNTYKQLLKTAAILSFGVALFQVVVTLVPEWARYFGAKDVVAAHVLLLYLTGLLRRQFLLCSDCTPSPEPIAFAACRWLVQG